MELRSGVPCLRAIFAAAPTSRPPTIASGNSSVAAAANYRTLQHCLANACQDTTGVKAFDPSLCAAGSFEHIARALFHLFHQVVVVDRLLLCKPMIEWYAAIAKVYDVPVPPIPLDAPENNDGAMDDRLVKELSLWLRSLTGGALWIAAMHGTADEATDFSLSTAFRSPQSVDEALSNISLVFSLFEAHQVASYFDGVALLVYYPNDHFLFMQAFSVFQAFGTKPLRSTESLSIDFVDKDRPTTSDPVLLPPSPVVHHHSGHEQQQQAPKRKRATTPPVRRSSTYYEQILVQRDRIRDDRRRFHQEHRPRSASSKVQVVRTPAPADSHRSYSGRLIAQSGNEMKLVDTTITTDGEGLTVAITGSGTFRVAIADVSKSVVTPGGSDSTGFSSISLHCRGVFRSAPKPYSSVTDPIITILFVRHDDAMSLHNDLRVG